MRKVFCLNGNQIVFCLLLLVLISAAELVTAQEKKTEPVQISGQKGKSPIIIIPGLIGSELINKVTKDTVWFRLTKSKKDDLRLPLSLNLSINKDNLIPGDIIRSVKYLKFLPETEIYEKLTDALERSGGYKEEKWETPSANGYQDSYYVFPYDWRRDNVENARLLFRQIEKLKVKLKRPNIKFNIIAHSMGGIIARYAARFGDADLPGGSGAVKPTWAGAKHFDKIFLLGTPNEGSLSSLNSLLNGYPLANIKGIKLPFIQDIDRFDVFTIPSAFQLLPHNGTARIYDENLKAVPIDLFSAENWEKYGWAAYLDPKFAKQFSPAEQRIARQYLRLVLSRAKRLQQALDSDLNLNSPVSFYLFGSDCKKTLEGMILYQDKKKNEWKEIFKPDSFTKSDGTKVSEEQVKDLLLTDGDGVVTKESLLVSSLPAARIRMNGFEMAIAAKAVYFACEDHHKLTGNQELQNRLFMELMAK